jgi:hypothetical protein
LLNIRLLPHHAVQGTGSYPPGCQGLQRQIRLNPIQPPLSTPYFRIASSVYCEHDGVNLHDGGKIGPINRW